MSKEPTDLTRNIVLITRSRHLQDKGDHFLLAGKPILERQLDAKRKLSGQLRHGSRDIRELTDNDFSAFSLGTGFFIDLAEDQFSGLWIATAAHVLLEANQYLHDGLDELYFIADYAPSGNEAQRIERSQVFVASALGEAELKLTHYDYSATNVDWAFLPVEPVDPDTSVATSGFRILSTDNPVAQGDEVTMIGYPLGLGAVKDSGKVIRMDSKTPEIFECRFAAFPGNSGSPILKLEGREWLACGILVRGTAYFRETDVTVKTSDGTREEKKYILENIGAVGKKDEEGEECQLLAPAIAALKLNSTRQNV